MEDSFYIGAYWGSRAETLPDVRNKILQTLQKLSEIDEQFINWYEGGMSRKQALEKKITLNSETIDRLCLEQVKKGELNENGFAKMGFLFGIWSGHKDDESNNISFNVGAAFTSPHLSNCLVITIPFEGVARERLLKVEKAKKIISVFVEIWNPDYAVLTSHQLRDKLNYANQVGWITYRRTARRIPKIYKGVIHEELNSGHLFTVSSPNYDIDSSVNEFLQVNSLISSRNRWWRF